MNPTEPSFIKASPIAMQTFLSKLPMSIEFCEEYKTDSPHWHDYVQIWYARKGTCNRQKIAERRAWFDDSYFNSYDHSTK